MKILPKSIVTEYMEVCAICGKPTQCVHHLIFGISNRALSDDDALILPMCNNCHNLAGGTKALHNNIVAEKLSKIIGQLAYEKRQVAKGFTEAEARDLFMTRYGRSYL